MDEFGRFKDVCFTSKKKLINILKNPGVKDDNILDKVRVKEEEILIENADWHNEDNRDAESDIESIKEEKSYNCEYCSESFSDEGTLKKHNRRHKYSCEYCNVSYIGLSSLVIHIKKKHKITPLSCEKCRKKFVLKRQLDLHILRVHTTSYKCPTCSKIFAKAHLLTKHQKRHATERLHHCLKCFRSFKTYETLRLHEKRIHSDPKTPVSCTICGVMVLNITVNNQVKLTGTSRLMTLIFYRRIFKHITRPKHSNVRIVLRHFEISIVLKSIENVDMMILRIKRGRIYVVFVVWVVLLLLLSRLICNISIQMKNVSIVQYARNHLNPSIQSLLMFVLHMKMSGVMVALNV